MAIIPGSVRLTGFIAPTDSNDTYPVTRPEWGLGGLRTVGNLALRDSITSQRREAGMLVYVISDDNYYKLETGLTNSDWVVVNFGTGATGITASNGLTETNGNITLGGSLTGDTYIDNSGFIFRSDTFSADTMSAQTIHVSDVLGYSPININDTIHIEESGNVHIGGVSPTEKLEISSGNIQIDNNQGLRIGTNIIDGGSGFFGSVNYLQLRTAADYSEPWIFMNASGNTPSGRFIQFALGVDSQDIGMTFMKPTVNAGGNISNNQIAVYDNQGLYTTANSMQVESSSAFILSNGSSAVLSGAVAVASQSVSMVQDWTLYTDNLNIVETPSLDNSLTQILVRDDSTGNIKYRDVSSIITGATSASTSSFSGLTDVNIDTGTTGNEFYYLTYSAGTAYNIEEFTYNLIVTSSGQTSFTLPAPPIEISKTKFLINGVKQNFNNQYNITGGTSLILDNSYDWSWISTDDILEINYLHL